ncbi:MAG: Lrp/AsnC ligand binding domain-containing protein [Chloroflexi bacterium]|nr:Lrp/AsnC ligand binding domain-containing protein [Chloroflexota bacterium]
MATRSFVLIETSIGKSRAALDALRKVNGVAAADAVTGPYDIICVLEARDLNAVGDVVSGQIHRVPGVSRTVTCVAMDAMGYR